MSRSKVGPFLLESPLGSPPDGAMFRAIHVSQRKLAALRVVSIPMGMTPESRRAFADELEDLKVLRHKHLVRCYGGGFDARRAFLAFELIDGESLADLLDRRGQLPWDTAFEFTEQIASALEFAHERQRVHGRLTPKKILVNREGVIKVGGWRRGVIADTFRSTESGAEELFLAPEQTQGGEATEKSDLYSLGVIAFFMLTGRPPFESPEQRAEEIKSGKKAPRVGQFVVDCPVWLEAAIAQMLEFDPKNRPHCATAVLLALREAKRRQAEGTGVLQHVASGFSPLRIDADRKEAEKLLGIDRKEKKKKVSAAPVWERPWFLAIALLMAVATTVWFLLPLSEAALRQRAEQLLPPASDKWMDWNAARDKYLIQLVERFPESENAKWAEEMIAWVDARETERRLNRDARRNRTSRWSDLEKQYWRARQFEEFNDTSSALSVYQAIVRLYGTKQDAKDIVYLAREGISRLQSYSRAPESVTKLIEERLNAADEAYAKGRVLEARQSWEAIVELYGDDEALSPLVEQARQRLREIAAHN